MNRRTFLKSMALGSASLAGAQVFVLPTAEARSGVWKNWSENVSFRPDHIYSPSSAEEVTRIISKFTQIRGVGAGHSFSAIVPGRILVSAEKLKSIRIHSEKMEVEAGAGVTLQELNKALHRQGFALPTMGEIDQQTVAGLVSTATKGTGVRFGSFSDEESFLGMSLIDGKGEIQSVDFASHSDVAPGLRMTLGAFGFVTSVRLKIVKAFRLKEQTFISTLEEALKEKHYLNHYRYAFYYYAHSDRTILRFQNPTDELISVEQRENRKLKIKYMENKLANAILAVASLKSSLIPRIEKMFFSTFKNETYVDHSHEVMIAGRTMRYLEMQYSLPVENLPQAMQKVKELTNRFAEAGKYYVDLPFFIRYTRGDRGTLMSPSQGEGIFAHIDVNAHHSQKGYEAFFKALELEFIQLGGRPHWGKLSYVPRADLFPEASRFEELRQRFDPRNKFQNDYVKKNISDRV